MIVVIDDEYKLMESAYKRMEREVKDLRFKYDRVLFLSSILLLVCILLMIVISVIGGMI